MPRYCRKEIAGQKFPAMLFNPRYSIFLYHQYTDMRKGHNTLSYIVLQKMNLNLLSGALFLFVAKNRKACKGIFFDGFEDLIDDYESFGG